MFHFVFMIPLGSGSDGPISTISKKVGISIIIGMLVGILALIVGVCVCNKQYQEQHHIGEQTCEKCHSHNTEGYHTFWNNDGTVAKSEKDADYTIMKCNDCGYTWHYELNNN